MHTFSDVGPYTALLYSVSVSNYTYVITKLITILLSNPSPHVYNLRLCVTISEASPSMCFFCQAFHFDRRYNWLRNTGRYFVLQKSININANNKNEKRCLGKLANCFFAIKKRPVCWVRHSSITAIIIIFFNGRQK